MKLLSILILTFSFTLSSYAKTTLWSSQNEKINLEIPGNWEQYPLNEYSFNSQSSAILLTGPNGSMNNDKSHKCSIFKLDHITQADVSQPLANSILTSWDEKSVSNQTQGVINVLGFTNSINSGVRVASLKYTANFDDIKMIVSQAQFMLATGGKKASFYTYSCFLPEKSNGVAKKTIKNIFSSLNFKL